MQIDSSAYVHNGGKTSDNTEKSGGKKCPRTKKEGKFLEEHQQRKRRRSESNNAIPTEPHAKRPRRMQSSGE